MSSVGGVDNKRVLEQRAELALRCATLRAHAETFNSVDPSGWLNAQLRDLADLLEVAEERGWFA